MITFTIYQILFICVRNGIYFTQNNRYAAYERANTPAPSDIPYYYTTDGVHLHLQKISQDLLHCAM